MQGRNQRLGPFSRIPLVVSKLLVQEMLELFSHEEECEGVDSFALCQGFGHFFFVGVEEPKSLGFVGNVVEFYAYGACVEVLKLLMELVNGCFLFQIF